MNPKDKVLFHNERIFQEFVTEYFINNIIEFKKTLISSNYPAWQVPQIFTYDFSQNGRAPNFGFRIEFLMVF